MGGTDSETRMTEEDEKNKNYIRTYRHTFST